MKLAPCLFALAFITTFFTPITRAQSASNRVTITAVLVAAARTPAKADPRLAGYEATLRRVLRFESFQQLNQATLDVAIPGAGKLALGSGQRLEIKTEPAEGQRRVQVSWFDGERALMNTGLVLRPGVPAVLGGPAKSEGEVYAVIINAE
jgi:hypothetical protein